jgi:protease-4
MWREISRAVEQKPVIISMGDVAASGGFWIATAGNQIVANPLTITGSIGVFSLALDTSGLFENKIGINFDVVRTGPFADMYSGTRALSPEEIRLLSQTTEETYQTFLELVAESRDMTVEEVDAVAQGRVWSGADAHRVGLVDVLGDLDTAINLAAEQAELQENDYSIKILPRPKTLLEQVNEVVGVQMARMWKNLTSSPAEQLLQQEAESLRLFTRLHGTVQAWLPGRFEIR